MEGMEIKQNSKNFKIKYKLYIRKLKYLEKKHYPISDLVLYALIYILEAKE